MKNKILSLLLVSAMAVTMLAGCGKKEEPVKNETEQNTENKTENKTTDGNDTDNNQTGDNTNPVTLKTVSMFGGTDPNVEAYTAINEAFQNEYDYITIEDNSQTADQDWKATVSADFAVGNEPDIIQFFTDATANAVLSADKFVTIEEIRAEYPEYAGETTDMALEAVTNPDGVQRAVPTTGFWEGLYCNKDLFDEHNIELPTDWDSLVTAVETFKENGIIPIALSLNTVPHYWIEFCMLYASGVEEFESIPETAPEGWIKGLEVVKTLRDLGAFPEDTDTVDDAYIGQLFTDKKAAMQLDGSWYAGSITDTDNTVVIAFPGVPDQKAEANTIINGMSTGFYITKKAWEDPDKRDAAVKFVMAHTSKEGVQKYWEATGKLQVTAMDMDEAEDLTPMGKSAMEYVKSAKASVSPTDSRIGGDPYTVLISNMSKISVGSASAEEVINEALELYRELSDDAE